MTGHSSSSLGLFIHRLESGPGDRSVTIFVITRRSRVDEGVYMCVYRRTSPRTRLFFVCARANERTVRARVLFNNVWKLASTFRSENAHTVQSEKLSSLCVWRQSSVELIQRKCKICSIFMELFVGVSGALCLFKVEQYLMGWVWTVCRWQQPILRVMIRKRGDLRGESCVWQHHHRLTVVVVAVDEEKVLQKEENNSPLTNHEQQCELNRWAVTGSHVTVCRTGPCYTEITCDRETHLETQRYHHFRHPTYCSSTVSHKHPIYCTFS